MIMSDLKVELDKQGQVNKQAMKVSLDLIKLAEQKHKSIMTALVQFEKKYQTPFPKTRYVETEDRYYRGGLFGRETKLTTLQISQLKAEGEIITGYYNNGDPQTDSFHLGIMDSRFVICTRLYNKLGEKNRFGSPITVTETKYKKHPNGFDDYSRPYKEQVSKSAESMCQTYTNPKKFYLTIHSCGASNPEDCALDHKDGKSVVMSSTDPRVKLFTKSELAIPKEFFNPAIWEKVNTGLDQFQKELVQISRENLQKMEEQKQYILKQKAKAPTKFSL